MLLEQAVVSARAAQMIIGENNFFMLTTVLVYLTAIGLLFLFK